jgi:hypothetical protein
MVYEGIIKNPTIPHPYHRFPDSTQVVLCKAQSILNSDFRFIPFIKISINGSSVLI